MGGTSDRHLARLRRRAAHDQGVVGRVRLPDLLPVHRGADDRRRRRLARLDRPGRLAAQRSAVGGRRPRAGVLRPGRDGADQHRRQRRARPAGHDARRRRDDARPQGRRPRRSSRTSPGRSGSSPPRLPSAIIQVANANMADAVRLISIRRGYDPREFALVVFGGAGPLHGAALARELGDPDGARTAESRYHVRARLPPGRHPARSRRRCSSGGRPTRSRPSSRRSSSGSRTRRASCSSRGRAGGRTWRSSATSRCATSASGARSRCRSTGRSRARRGRRALPRRARARVRLPPRRRARRGLPAPAHRGRRHPEARVRRRHATDGGLRRSRSRARQSTSTRSEASSTTPVYDREDLPAGDELDGPGDHRPARLDHARAAGRDGRGRRVPQHPHGTGGERR